MFMQMLKPQNTHNHIAHIPDQAISYFNASAQAVTTIQALSEAQVVTRAYISVSPQLQVTTTTQAISGWSSHNYCQIMFMQMLKPQKSHNHIGHIPDQAISYFNASAQAVTTTQALSDFNELYCLARSNTSSRNDPSAFTDPLSSRSY